MLADLREQAGQHVLPPAPVLHGDWIIVGDVHAPLFSETWIERVVIVSRRLRIKNLIIAGDFFDMGNFSVYAPAVPVPSWAQERQAAGDILRYWCRTFDRIVMLMGNHERRLQRFAMAQLDEIDLLSLVRAPDQVSITPRGFAVLETAHGSYRITHPKNYSINRLSVANDLALKFDQHIVAFHEHHLALGWDRYGRHLIINGGSLVDPQKLVYAALDDSKAATMQNGFVSIQDGVPRLWGNPPISSWKK